MAGLSEMHIQALETIFLFGTLNKYREQINMDLIARKFINKQGELLIKGKQFLRELNDFKCAVPPCNNDVDYDRLHLCRRCNHYYVDEGLRGEELLEATYQPSTELLKLLDHVMREGNKHGLPITQQMCEDEQFYAAMEEGFYHKYLKFSSEARNSINVTAEAFALDQLEDRPNNDQYLNFGERMTRELKGLGIVETKAVVATRLGKG